MKNLQKHYRWERWSFYLFGKDSWPFPLTQEPSKERHCDGTLPHNFHDDLERTVNGKTILDHFVTSNKVEGVTTLK